ncbi:hypothetical protein ABE096_22200 [Robertmurraya massiliosenegalensis]|uniref:hypothetical protein n=1 Tax=Robertmurraya TaxID=2837507 RepID=UPI0039A52515
MFTNEQLQDLIAGKAIGDKFPYDTGNEQEIEAHIRRLFHRINRIPHIICEAEWNHFGSGYASFVEFFCYTKNNVTVESEKYGIRKEKTEGIIIDICRLAPVAIMGEDDRSKTIRIESNEVLSGGYGSIISASNQLYLREEFHELGRQLKLALEEYEYALLDFELISAPLPFRAEIPTIYKEPGDYIIMDAIFYWED